MKKYDPMDTSDSYTYGLDLSGVKIDLPKTSNKSKSARKRYICIDLEKMVAEGRFREDLYYRINTTHISLPALRERPEDVMPLAERFLAINAEKYRRNTVGISPEAAELLKSHAWSGNIRELQNTIEKAVILSEGSSLKADDLSLERKSVTKAAPKQTLDEAEEKTIRDTMARCNGNLTLVAKELGISRPTLYSKLKKYEI